MAFTTRRGRPPRPSVTDTGTPELRFKHAHGLTAEPIDVCLEQQHITIEQHRSGMHLRWLYTVRYGAPSLTTCYNAHESFHPRTTNDPAWRLQREAEYHAATKLLRTGLHYEPVMRLCVFNEWPTFLKPHFRQRAWEEPALAHRLNQERAQLSEGLETLASHWKGDICGRKRADQ